MLEHNPTLSDISRRYGDCIIGVQLSDAAVIRNQRTIAETVRCLWEQWNRWRHDVVVWTDTSCLGHPTTISFRNLLVTIVTCA